MRPRVEKKGRLSIINYSLYRLMERLHATTYSFLVYIAVLKRFGRGVTSMSAPYDCCVANGDRAQEAVCLRLAVELEAAMDACHDKVETL
jgi:hypothetical protein